MAPPPTTAGTRRPRTSPSTDVRGKEWRLHGVGRTTFPLQAWPDIVFFNALMEWTDQDGRTGPGEVMDFYGIADLSDLQAKRGMGPLVIICHIEVN